MWTIGSICRLARIADGVSRIALLAILVSLATAAGEELEVAQGERLDLGQAMVGQVLNGVIDVKNSGKEKIEIQRISVSCGCSAVASDKKSLAPGDTLEIRITFNRRNLPASLSSDIIVEGVTASGRNTSVKVQVLGQYAAAFLVSPSPIVETASGESLEDREISLQIREIDPRIVSIQIKGEPEHVVALKKWERNDGDDKTLSFKIKLRELYYGTNSLVIPIVGIARDGTIVGELSVPLAVSLKGDIEPKPSQILALGADERKAISKQIVLESRGNKEINLVRVYADAPWISCRTLKPSGEENQRILCLELAANRTGGLGNVFIEYLDNARVCTLRVPIAQTTR